MDVNMEHGEGGPDTTNNSGQDLMNSDPPSGPMPTTVESQPIQDGHPELVIPGGTKAKATSASSTATGPRTRQGKERSKYNAIKHGIFSNLPFLHGESKAQFDSLLNGLREDRKPEGTQEDLLVEILAMLFWRYRRFIVAQGTYLPTPGDLSPLGALEDSAPMDRWVRYEASLERSIERVLKLLERFQRIRLGLAVPPSVDLNNSP
ncbi:MAG: hypothetical protein ACHP8A_17330 [Terriglobales bacterium]